MTRYTLSLAFALISSTLFAADPAPWATYRGNTQRTGNTDGKAGPDKPSILWAVKSLDHYVASPVPLGDSNLYVSAICGLNRPEINSYPTADAKQATWKRSAPYLRLSTVSSPAVSGNLIVFGDGMHQDSGGILHCMTADTGRPVWQLPLAGDLIHLEGSPSILDGKVYMGGGSAGVICVDLDSAILDGKPVKAAGIAKMQADKWKELQAAYEEKKKKDPDLAVPPSEDDLLKPAPKLLWQKGKDKWHVDAPVCAVDGKVLVCTSFLDKEQKGERAIYCLDAKTGDTLWSQKLIYNPWGGASVSGDTVIVTGSSVGYYFTELKGAKGEIAAFELKTGKPIWKKDVARGGVVAAAALTKDIAVFTATDGKVRAFALKDGETRWIYDAKGAIFAPPAIAGDMVYVGDLLGAIHAVDLKGVPKWKFDLGTEADVKLPGMIYGGVTAHGGKLFVGTVNLEGPNVRKGTCLVCIGTK